MDHDNSIPPATSFDLLASPTPQLTESFTDYFMAWAKMLQEPERREALLSMRQLMAEEGEGNPDRDETENLAMFIYRRFSGVHPRAFAGRFMRDRSVTVEMLRKGMNPPPPAGVGYWWES